MEISPDESPKAYIPFFKDIETIDNSQDEILSEEVSIGVGTARIALNRNVNQYKVEDLGIFFENGEFKIKPSEDLEIEGYHNLMLDINSSQSGSTSFNCFMQVIPQSQLELEGVYHANEDTASQDPRYKFSGIVGSWHLPGIKQSHHFFIKANLDELRALGLRFEAII